MCAITRSRAAVAGRRRKPRNDDTPAVRTPRALPRSQTSTTTTAPNVRSAGKVPGRAGKSSVTPRRVGSEVRDPARDGPAGEYGCDTERTSRFGVALGQGTGRHTSDPAGN